MGIDSAALLRERGIQVTAQRLAVFRAVTAHPHITADGVAEVSEPVLAEHELGDALGAAAPETFEHALHLAGRVEDEALGPRLVPG